MAMAKIQRGNNLSEEPPGFFRGQPALLDQIVKELSTRNMFKHQIPGTKQEHTCKLYVFWRLFTLVQVFQGLLRV